MQTKSTKCSAVFSMIISIIMLVAYYIVGRVYILVAALASAGENNGLVSVAMNMVIILGIVSMVLALANIVISIITLAKVKKTSTFEKTKIICLLLMILLFVQVGLNTLITILVALMITSIQLIFVHIPFVLFYLLCALGVMKNYRKNKVAVVNETTIEANEVGEQSTGENISE